ncbi:hypothetical protein PPERSA_12888 [Pseudocohnilembus persalinus]|uniref:EamA domain-containing protein n=1 Tax=Pseudocohnilembus persalinus TaxID=266149 RepID=A0A0V0Q861_PSEPJ|nr:hypothetical protein PPERSA_12888 [Pseudocohnilembus persalinus]|eukprot:KRW98409.1 hypothetical protein PPERSA_12888 [Pseudocohnilembus persalinus]
MKTPQNTQQIGLLEKLTLQFDKKFQYAPYIYMLICSTTMSLLQLCIKIEQEISVFQILMIRGMISYCINYRAASYDRYEVYPKNKQTNSLLIQRGTIQSLTVFFMFTGCQMIELGIANILWLSNPLWTVIVSVIFYNQKFNVGLLKYIILCFVGIILIFKPPAFLVSSKIEEIVDENQEQLNEPSYFDFIPDNYRQIIGQSVSLLAAILFAFLANISSKLKGKTSPSILLQYMYVGNITFSGCMLIAFGYSSTKPFSSFYHIGMMLIITVLSLVSQYFMQLALMKANPQKVVPLIQIQVLYAVIYDYFIFGNIIQPGSVIGSILIVFCCYRIAVKK